MRVLVTFAIENEFAPWRRMHKWSVTDAVLEAYETTVGNTKVFVVLTGVGSEHAWDSTAITHWGEHPFDVIVSSGLAGALRAEHKVGEVLVARAICDFKPQKPLQCDKELVQLAGMCGAKIVQAFYTSDQIMIRAEEKRKLADLADAVEMESRRVVGQGHMPGWRDSRCVAIRAISDEVEENLPLDFNKVLDFRGDVKPRLIMAEVIRRPQILPSLVRFGWRSLRAAKSLAIFLDRYIMELEKISVSAHGAPLAEAAAR
jgi:nucleoside phosphorylase